jgi:hypothetical protein
LHFCDGVWLALLLSGNIEAATSRHGGMKNKRYIISYIERFPFSSETGLLRGVLKGVYMAMGQDFSQSFLGFSLTIVMDLAGRVSV